MNFTKFKRIFLSTLFLTLPLNSSFIFANELNERNKNSILIAEAQGYREHEDKSENENDTHSINHDWNNHYHTIKSIKLKRNGNLKIRFCEKVELLEGQVYADNIKYDVKDAYKIKTKENSFNYYDAESGLLIMTEESTNQGGNTITSITKFSDYREVDGILYAFKREITAGPQKIEFEITSVIFNEEISDEFFK